MFSSPLQLALQLYSKQVPYSLKHEIIASRGLKGDWKGYHSIRVNNQWRLIFRWTNGNAFDVRIVDYH